MVIILWCYNVLVSTKKCNKKIYHNKSNKVSNANIKYNRIDVNDIGYNNWNCNSLNQNKKIKLKSKQKTMVMSTTIINYTFYKWYWC